MTTIDLEVEIEQFARGVIALLTGWTEDGSSVVCISCGGAVRVFRQAGRSVVAEPCGHRQGQGDARFFNAQLADGRGLKDVSAPEAGTNS